MRESVVITAAVLVTSASLAGQATFESVQSEFLQKALTLLSEKDTSPADFQTKIAKAAYETFGAHPDVMRKEAADRFNALPPFPAASLTSYAEYKSCDQLPLTEARWVLLMSGWWAPEKLADSAKKAMLYRQLGTTEYGRLALVNVCCPDKVYRLGKGEFPELVVDSLGALFVIKVKMTKIGVCRPVSVRWMKKKVGATRPTSAK